MRTLAIACLLVTACGAKPPVSNRKAPDAGIAIALYRDGDTSYGVVDDRRWVDISGSSILLGNIDPGAALASLTIETENPAMKIGPCTRERLPDLRENEQRSSLDRYEEELRRARMERDRMSRRYRQPVPRPQPKPVVRTTERFAPIVQCDVAGKPGRYLVRIVYVSNTLSYRVQHDVELTDPTKASIESRFALQTPHWREQAEVVLFEGVPGGLEPPKEITRGHVTLDGGTSVLIVPTRDVPATLRRVFEGASFDDEEAQYYTDQTAVWATLEVPNVELAPGPIRVHVAIEGDDERYIDVPMQKKDRFEEPDPANPDKKPEDEPLRIKLWIDPTLRGTRQRLVVENDGLRMVEMVTLAVSNNGEAPREVWLEEHARTAKKRTIERAWPKKPSARGDTVRNKVTVKAGRVEKVGYAIVYDM